MRACAYFATAFSASWWLTTSMTWTAIAGMDDRPDDPVSSHIPAYGPAALNGMQAARPRLLAGRDHFGMSSSRTTCR